MNNILDFSKNINKIEKIIDYKFKDKELLLKAFTHPSFNQKNNYEKIEFVGDSLINSFATVWLYENKKKYNVGKLSIEKSQIINNKFLSQIVYFLKLDQYIIVGKKVEINEKITSDVFESLSAAIFFDSNIDSLHGFLNKTIITNFLVFDKNIDYKGKFINHIQNKNSNQYKFDTSFDNDCNMFITTINIQNEKILGIGKNKKSAEQCASKNALLFINK